MKLKNVLGLLVTATIMSTSVWVVTHQQEIEDWWRLRDFNPSVEIQQLAVDSGMSNEGERLFYVYAPELLPKSEFNGICIDDEETIVLGCYIAGQKIYVFDVDNDRLAGIEEVTAAHEMLHVVYERLSSEEQAKLDSLLLSTFRELDDERLNETIANYRKRDPSVVANELHSILGTEVRDLPQELEEHYAQYFDNRLAVVSLAEAYEAEFTALEDRIEEYDVQIAQLGSQINQQEQDIKQLGVALERERQQLEALRSQPEQFNEAIPAYNDKVRDYNRRITELQQNVNEYNKLVEVRNSIALEEQELIQSIDSSYQELE